MQNCSRNEESISFSRAVFSEKVGIVAKHQRVGFYLLDPNTLVRKQRIESGGFFPLKFSLDGATLFGRGILDQDKDCACVWQTGDWSRADHAFPSFALEVAIDAQTRRIARNTADTIEGWQLHGDNKPKQLWSISKKYEDYGLTLSADGQSFFILVSTTHQFVPSKTERIMGLAMATGQWLWSVSMPEQCSGLSASLDGSKLFFSCLDLGVNGEQLTAKGSVGAILLDDKCIVDTGVTKTVARKESSGSFPPHLHLGHSCNGHAGF